MSIRENVDITPFASAARTATATSSVFENRYAKGVVLRLDITAAAGTTPTLDVKLQGVNELGVAWDIAGAAFAQATDATGDSALTVYPGVAETANVSVSDVLPRRWQVVATIAGTTPSFTFSLSGSYIV